MNLGFDGGKTELPQPFWEIGQDFERYDVSAIDADFFCTCEWPLSWFINFRADQNCCLIELKGLE